jgi:hypothetical protein
MINAPECPYCQNLAELVGGDIVYPHRPDLHQKQLWLCRPCEAWCGVHPGTTIPLGFPAKKDLRRARRIAAKAEGGTGKPKRKLASRLFWPLTSDGGGR